MTDMRVVWLLPDLAPVGPNNVMLNVAEKLCRQLRIEVVGLAQSVPGDLFLQFQRRGAAVTALDGNRWLHALRANGAARHAIGPAPNVLVHAHGLRPSLLAAQLDCPTVSTVHSVVATDFAYEYGPVVGRVGWRVYRRALLRATSVTAVSGAVRSFLATNGVTSTLVCNAVDTSFWRPPTSQERSSARQAYAIGEDTKVVVFVGRLVERKDPLAAVRAFEASAAIENGALLLVAGTGPLHDAIVSRAGTGRSVRVLGHVADVRSVLWAADAVVSYSRAEGVPMGVLEAVATGLPAVLSDIAPHREVHAQLSDGAVVIVDHEVGSRVRELDRVLARAHCERPRLPANSPFAAEVAADSWLNVYEEAVRKWNEKRA